MPNLDVNGMERYSRQALFWGIREEGQRRLRASTVVVVGCGALGCAAITLLARAGIGQLVVIDRDFVELSNLQRQILFEEADAESGLPKAVAAASAVERINSAVTVKSHVADLTPANAEILLAGADVVIDGTDNFETRYLVNDACVKMGIPWVYGGALGSSGMSMTILPHDTACFRCVFPQGAPAGSVPTCETAGVLGSIVTTVAAMETVEALKILVGDHQHMNRGLILVDLWTHDYEYARQIRRDPDCICCGQGKYEYLEAEATSRITSLCGRNAVQVRPSAPHQIRLVDLAQRLRAAGTVTSNEYLVRLLVDSYELTIFPDGRAIIKGTDDQSLARSLYARYVGV